LCGVEEERYTDTLWSLRVDVEERTLIDAVCQTRGNDRSQASVGKIGGAVDLIIISSIIREVKSLRIICRTEWTCRRRARG
jgi:hypothetical protein